MMERTRPEGMEPQSPEQPNGIPKATLIGALTPVSPHPRSHSGPKTAAGKAAVALNALKDGVFSEARVLSGIERAEDWESHMAGMTASHEPADYLDTVLLARAADRSWKMERLRRHEAAVLVRNQAQHEFELAEFLAKLAKQRGLAGWGELELPAEAKTLGLTGWSQLASLEEALALARVRLEPLDQLAQAGKLLPRQAVDDLLAQLIGNLNLPPRKIPGKVAKLRQSTKDPVPAAAVLKAVKALATATGTKIGTLIHRATEDGRKTERMLQELMTWVRAQRAELEGLQLLPDPDALQRINRRDAFLERSFFRTLYELEARKARRRGQTVAMAQLQVDGAPEEGEGT